MTFRIDEVLHRRVRRWTARYSTLWFNVSGNPPLSLRSYSRQEQRDREERIDRLRRKARHHGKIRHVIAFIAQEMPGMHTAHVRQFLETCGRTGEKFVARARAFDPDLSDADIQQALRNLWVFNSIQCFLGKPVSLSPSSFAYSLLYPYTDNSLDRAGESEAEKQALLRWLSTQLRGHVAPPDGPRRGRIAALLGMIRKEHPPTRRSSVQQSLLAIHRAQTSARRLHGATSKPTEHVLVPLTIEKGGTSVLVDGFLADRLNDREAETIFGYGVLLQLIDDLQDLQEDVDRGDSTPFTRAVRHGTLEGITNRLFNLVGIVAGKLRDLEDPREGHVSELVERSCTTLIQEAVARHAHLYRKGYLTMINSRTPVRLTYLRSLAAR